MLETALDICVTLEKKITITGRDDGATGEEFAKYIMDTLTDPQLEKRFKEFSK